MSARRLARRLGWDRNKMRRASDRIEALLAASLLLFFLVATPYAGGWAARSVYRADVRQQAWDRLHLHYVYGVLIEDPQALGVTDSTGLPVAQSVARARWTAPDGSLHIGTVQVTATDRAGGRIALWLDDRGAPSGPPAQLSPRTDAVAAATGVALGAAAFLGAAYLAARRLLDRRRLRSWQQEWLEVGPRWTRHR